MSQAIQRVGVLLLVLCMALQTMAHVTQRAAAGLHYHLPVADSVAIDLAWHDDEHDHDHEHGHTHGQLAEHAHTLADASVRYVVDGDDIAAPQPPIPPPRVHDHDGLLIQMPIGASRIERERWPAETGPLIRSVVSIPLERPPRA